MKKIIPIIASFIAVGCTPNKTLSYKNSASKDTVHEGTPYWYEGDSIYYLEEGDSVYFYWEEEPLTEEEIQKKIDDLNKTAEEVKKLIGKGILHE